MYEMDEADKALADLLYETCKWSMIMVPAFPILLYFYGVEAFWKMSIGFFVIFIVIAISRAQFATLIKALVTKKVTTKEEKRDQ